MFINKKFYRFMESGEVKTIPLKTNNNHPTLLEFQKTPKKIYYLGYMNFKKSNISMLKHILKSEGILKKLRKSKTDYFLLLHHNFEGYSQTAKVIAEVFVHKLGIPGRKIHMLSESHSFKNNAREFFDLNDCPTVSTAMELEIQSKRSYERLKTLNTPQETNAVRKRFLCLNNRGRPHRAIFLSMLKANRVLNNCYYSLIPSSSENNNKVIVDFHRILSDFVVQKSPNYYKKINEWLSHEGLESLFNILDTNSFVTEENAWQPNDRILRYYNQTDISVITETHFFLNGIKKHDLMFTEKVFRPILLGHPFIVLSVPGYLEGLKQLGYRTFGNVFDESYDSIKDDIERMEAVATELERLNSLSNKAFAKLVRKTKNAVDHNRDILSKLQSPRFFYDSSVLTAPDAVMRNL